MAKRLPHTRDLLKELEKLGSAKAIAKELQQRGISGKRKIDDKCPLANFIGSVKTRDDQFYWVDTRKNRSRPYPKEKINKGEVECPPICSQFVRNFDDGKYPFLEVK